MSDEPIYPPEGTMTGTTEKEAQHIINNWQNVPGSQENKFIRDQIDYIVAALRWIRAIHVELAKAESRSRRFRFPEKTENRG